MNVTAELDLRYAEQLADGSDSVVYRLGGMVAKEYKRLSLEAVSRYVDLQNAAAELLARLDYRAELSLWGTRYALVVGEAVPVDHLGVSSAGRPVTLSRYVAAPNLAKIESRPDAFARYARAHLTDPRVRELGHRLNALLWQESSALVHEELEYHLDMLSRRLDRELGVSGLHVGKPNVKLMPGGQPRTIELVLTDVAVFIERVDFG